MGVIAQKGNMKGLAMHRDYTIASVWKRGVRHVIVTLDCGVALHCTPERNVQIDALLTALDGRCPNWTTVRGPWMSDDEIVARARALQATRTYSVHKYNCEDFMHELLGLDRGSPTRDTILAAGALAGLVAVVVRARA